MNWSGCAAGAAGGLTALGVSGVPTVPVLGGVMLPQASYSRPSKQLATNRAARLHQALASIEGYGKPSVVVRLRTGPLRDESTALVAAARLMPGAGSRSRSSASRWPACPSERPR